MVLFHILLLYLVSQTVHFSSIALYFECVTPEFEYLYG